MRAYTSIDPGDWNIARISTNQICKIINYIFVKALVLLATVSGFSITQLNTTSISVMWETINTTGVSHYTVYYSTCTCKEQIN